MLGIMAVRITLYRIWFNILKYPKVNIPNFRLLIRSNSSVTLKTPTKNYFEAFYSQSILENDHNSTSVSCLILDNGTKVIYS